MSYLSEHLPDPERQPEFYSDVPLKRLLAWAVDTITTLAICLVILPFTAFTAVLFFPLLMLTVSFVYRVITLSRKSATWGMRLTSIEFLTADGQPFDTRMAMLHTCGFSVSCVFPILQIISIIMMGTGARGQGLTDLTLGTVVINRRARH